MTDWAPAPYRTAFDSARDPYTARNALGITTVAIGAQPLDGDLTAIAALTGTNTIYYRSAANTWSPVTVGTGLAFSGGTLAVSPTTWTAYTPTITAGSGTFTSVSATGRHLIVGKLTHIQIIVTITTNGTAASFVQATTPNTCAATAMLAGREIAVAGFGLVAQVNASAIIILKYDASYPGSNGAQLVVSGIYENS